MRPVNHSLRASNLLEINNWALGILEPVETEEVAVAELALGETVTVVSAAVPAMRNAMTASRVIRKTRTC